jgi:transcriptional regulator with XRE-family HTH domain
MSQRGIANWEIRPNSSPTPEQMVLLSDVLDVSIEELVRGDAEEIRKSAPVENSSGCSRKFPCFPGISKRT